MTYLPIALIEIPRWVCWRYEMRKGKSTKRPICAQTGGFARIDAPTTWSDFWTAIDYCNNRRCDGVGIVLNGDGLVGVDLDHCIDERENIEPWAEEIIAELNPYTERSPSGRGIRIFAYGSLPPFGCRKGRFEIYSDRHYLTVTGNHVEGTSPLIENRCAELTAIHARFFVQHPVNKTHPNAGDLSDQELLNRARRARSGDKFSRLYDRGDISNWAFVSPVLPMPTLVHPAIIKKSEPCSKTARSQTGFQFRRS